VRKLVRQALKVLRCEPARPDAVEQPERVGGQESQTRTPAVGNRPDGVVRISRNCGCAVGCGLMFMIWIGCLLVGASPSYAGWQPIRQIGSASLHLFKPLAVLKPFAGGLRGGKWSSKMRPRGSGKTRAVRSVARKIAHPIRGKSLSLGRMRPWLAKMLPTILPSWPKSFWKRADLYTRSFKKVRKWPTYQAAFQALENFLKAYLLRKGATPEHTHYEIGHKLREALNEAKARDTEQVCPIKIIRP